MYFVRHGQSEFNLGYETLGCDPGIRDAPLTPFGFDQARQAALSLAGKGITQIISSPYSRALQTASIIAAGIGAALHVEPLAGERALYSCDIGTPASLLRANWARLDFSGLAEEWWPGGGETHAALTRRVTDFTAKWRERAASGDHAIVSHWYFIHAVTGRDLQNGEVYFRKIF